MSVFSHAKFTSQTGRMADDDEDVSGDVAEALSLGCGDAVPRRRLLEALRLLGIGAAAAVRNAVNRFPPTIAVGRPLSGSNR